MLGTLPRVDYASHPDYVEIPRREDLAEKAITTLEPLLETKRNGLAASAPAFDGRPKSGGYEALDKLARDGVVSVRLTPAQRERITRAVSPVEQRLEQQVEDVRASGTPLKFSHTLLPIWELKRPVAGMEDQVATIMDVLRDAGILALASDYYAGFEPTVSALTLKRNVCDQEFFVTPDRATGTTKTGGMHIDSNSMACFNGIIYLNDVGPEQGPLSYVVGSNQWAFDREDRAIRKAVDESGFGGGRGRKYFAQLPAEYQRKAAFGWDLADDSAESQALLGNLRPHCSDAGDLVLFDSDGVHRGGDVSKGFRSSILFCLTMREPKRGKS